MKEKIAIAFRRGDNSVIIVVSMDGKIWKTTEEARKEGFEIFYR